MGEGWTRRRFCLASAEDLLLASHAGKPLVALAVIYRINPLVFVVLGQSDIRPPRNFAGRRLVYAGNDGRTPAALVMQRFNAGQAPLLEVRVDRDYADLTGGAPTR